jgi:hypothetical protein
MSQNSASRRRADNVDLFDVNANITRRILICRGARLNDKGERVLHEGERIDHLHQAAPPDLLGKVTW